MVAHPTHYETAVSDILDAIDYQEDKQAFITTLTMYSFLRAFAALLKTLPEQDAKQIRQKLRSSVTLAQAHAILTRCVTEETLDKAMEEQGRKALSDYTRSHLTVLSSEQKEKLIAALAKHHK